MYPTESMPGYGIFVKNVVDGLALHDVEVVYSALINGRGKNIFQKLIKYSSFYLKIILYFFKSYDAIYIHFPNHALPILLPLLMLKKRRIIVNLHGEDLLYEDRGVVNKVLGKLNDIFLKEVNLIIVPSTYFKSILIDRNLCTEKTVFVSPSGGIKKDVFYSFSEVEFIENKILGYVGRIEDGKGWREYVEVLNILKKENNNVKGIMIGNGTLINELESLIEQYELVKNIEIIKAVNQNELCGYYNKFELLIFSSSRTSESLGLVGIEAMACGIPVIGTDIGGIPSYLVDNFNGFLVGVGNVDSIVSSIIAYRSLDDNMKNKMKLNCLKTAESYFSDNVIENLSIKMKSVL